MSDDAEAQAQLATTVQYEFVPSLPGGRSVLPVEREGELIFLISLGEMTEQCREELNEYAHHITTKRLWNQNWGGSTREPPQLREAS